MPKIHPTAIVSNKAEIAPGVEIGPYAIIDDDVEIGENCKIGPRVHVYPNSILGSDVRIYDGAVIGSDPQDLKYSGELSFLRIGKRVRIREYCTVNRGTGEGGVTIVEDDVLLMAYAHVAHDCRVGKGVVLANGVQLGGHVEIGNHSVIGGNTAVHQFCKVGRGCFIGGTLKIDRHIPPWVKALGDPLSFAGLNHVGLERQKKSEWVLPLNNLYKKIYRKGCSWKEAIDTLSTSIGYEKEMESFFKENQGMILGISRKNRP